MKNSCSIIILGLGLLPLGCGGAPDGERQDDASTGLGADQQDGNLTGPTSTVADKQLLDTVEEASFRYFWDFAHPASGMARERSSSGDLVTTGGSGFGVQAIIVGASRGFITRTEAVDRLTKICDFLGKADRFHGAWSHWIDGNTGRVIPFGPIDNGGDLIETAFLINGLLTASAYFNAATPAEAALRQKITQLWEAVEWSWYASRGDGKLYWHWSPTTGWVDNLAIQGWNEGLVAYILALGSPTHPISPAVYTSTWTNAGYGNHTTYEGYDLDIGPAAGGPLFLAHYSFLSMDPRQMQDQFTNYWQHNVKHTLVNRSYCINSAPASYGYSASLWGLTASDEQGGYSAHSPTNDDGTVTPTAALSSFPYTPFYSMQVLRNFYGGLKGKLVGVYGPRDAYSAPRDWVDPEYLAIDQGPIVAMIENYRSGLLWKLFTRRPEVQAGLSKANIHKPAHDTGFPFAVVNVQNNLLDVLKHPDLNAYPIDVSLKTSGTWTLSLLRSDGSVAEAPWKSLAKAAGLYRVSFGASIAPGAYRLQLSGAGVTRELRVFLH